MTKEQLEQKAEERVSFLEVDWSSHSIFWLDGYEYGIESEKKKNEWHDLVKNPNDLPKAGSHVLVKVTYKEDIEQRKFDSYNIFIAVYGDGYCSHKIGNTFYGLSCYRKDSGEDNLGSVLDNTFAWKEIE